MFVYWYLCVIFYMMNVIVTGRTTAHLINILGSACGLHVMEQLGYDGTVKVKGRDKGMLPQYP